MKVWLLWNCPSSCIGYSRGWNGQDCFKYRCCEIKKRSIQKFLVINAKNQLITTETQGIDFNSLEMQSKNIDWKQYLKPCYVHVIVKTFEVEQKEKKQIKEK